ncbi:MULTISPECIES: App1 family protein [unclassified Actinotalea]|uniref:App1 family protein n=1 Tax=unclassified Actinotalea TaxID=2638618 RepID=UPI0015F60752|nr:MULTISPECIES: phosphatase domain-containing protein [unclassified Actinotalea]
MSNQTGSSRPHRAARLEDRLNGFLVDQLDHRGWVPRIEPYTGYGAPGWVRIMARALLAPPGTTAGEATERDPESAQRAVRGWRSFLTAQVADVEVEVQVGSRTHTVRSDRGGYVDTVVEADLEPGWGQATLTLGGRSITAPLLIVGADQRTALVSDIDDTVMVTALPRPMLAAYNSMVLHENARRVVPGMSAFYRRWGAANPGAPTFYLSTGAWNVAPAIRRFLERHGYPSGPLLLTDWGPTNTGWFRSGQHHKRETLRRLMTEFPHIRWVLVGDDGQHDPQIYGDIAAEHPDRVELIAIRQLTPAEQVLAHGTPTPAEDDDLGRRGDTAAVVHGGDGNEIALKLVDAGLLPAAGQG